MAPTLLAAVESMLIIDRSFQDLAKPPTAEATEDADLAPIQMVILPRIGMTQYYT